VIIGRFGNTTGRPYVNGRLLLPRLNLSSNLSFLVDTGADVSTLMPTDGLKMNINYQTLGDSMLVDGIGGNARCFQEEAVLAFDEPNRNLIRFYAITLMILEAQQALTTLPSIVGRDILDRWRMNYDPSRNKLEFTVRSADLTI
jgi:hypothetical protein